VWRDRSPSWSPDGREILFSSDRDGIIGIYTVDLEGNGGKLLSGLEALLDPRISSDGTKLYFSCFKQGQFRIHMVPMPVREEKTKLAAAPADSLPPWSWRGADGRIPIREGRYRSRLSLEIAQGAVALDPNFRGGQGVQALLADMMSNHLLFLQLGNATFSTDDFVRNFSVGASYVNQSRRLNYGVSAFHFVGDYLDEQGLPYHDRRAGASAILIYPISKFQRVELINGVAYAETERISTGFERKGAVAQHSAAWIHDTSLWLPTGPIDGHRMNLTVGATLDLKKGQSESLLLIGDYRRYLRLGTRSAYAIRVQGLYSQGPNPRTFFLGGSLSLRGYQRRAFEGERSLLVNQEVRFPLVKRWMFHLPMGPLEFPSIQGAFFFDAGRAWDGDSIPRLAGSFGGSMRMGLGGILVLRLDLARRTDFRTLGDRNHWDFFIGWNY
ncbi:MAG: BamA/TamA family outer membrane protein, partial [Candidatus Eisenbacteria bacterium]|nr:BamA/TamA family outer membrane protein [Candidatus Latescibacterota bacterium]MBD3302430.1 BamA/TamA family outer membrane protein [Candidatus Eisenbacteria bacterium]